MSQIAIWGTGQLALYLAQSAHNLDIPVKFIAEPGDDTDVVNGVAPIIMFDKSGPIDQLVKELEGVSVVTYEKESIDVRPLEALAKTFPIAPSIEAVSIAQDRLVEKTFLRKQGLKTANFWTPKNQQELLSLFDEHGQSTLFVKTRRDGYDGKGQWHIKEKSDVLNVPTDMIDSCIVEQGVAFETELSVISARNTKNDITHYSLTENTHKNGILHESVTPSPYGDNLQQKAEAIAQSILEGLDYVGVLAIEFFLVNDELLINEIAPRVHNSGHWTMSGAACSQFENHIRAISGMNLGSTEITSPTKMYNIIGENPLPPVSLAGNSQLFWYGKKCRKGRKLGHINICS